MHFKKREVGGHRIFGYLSCTCGVFSCLFIPIVLACVLSEWQLDSQALSALFSHYYLCPVGGSCSEMWCQTQGGPQMPHIHTSHLAHRAERRKGWKFPESFSVFTLRSQPALHHYTQLRRLGTGGSGRR